MARAGWTLATVMLVTLFSGHTALAQLHPENREPKGVTQLNTLVVGGDNYHPILTVTATPTLTGSALTVDTSPPQHAGASVRRVVEKLATKTIYGFLDFVTTVGGTVVVFTPEQKTEAPTSDSPAEPATRPPSEEVSVSPTSARPVIVSTSATIQRPELRFTPSPEPSEEVDNNLLEDDVTPAPEEETSERTNHLWSHIRSRRPSGKRPFILPQRRNGQSSATPSLPKLSSLQARRQPTGLFQRNFLSKNSDSKPVRPSALSGSPVGLVTTRGGTVVSGDLTTVHRTSVIGTVVDGSYAQLLQSSSIIFSAPAASAAVTRASSVIHGAATEYPDVPGQQEALPLERLYTTLEEPLPTPPIEASGSLSSLQERLKARLQAALSDARPSREVAAAARTGQRSLGSRDSAPTAGSSEVRQRSRESAAERERSHRPDIPLLPRRSFSSRHNVNRLSATEKLKQRLLKQRQDRPTPAPAQEPLQQPDEDDVSDDYDAALDIRPDEVQNDGELVAINTYNPQEATDYYYVLTTRRTLHERTLGRYTNTQWLSFTETETVSVTPTVAPTRTTKVLVKKTVVKDSQASVKPEKEHGNAVMLPAVKLDPSKPSLPLETMTETYSTTQLVLKSSVIPLVIGETTKRITLTQSYQVTRMVTALKTMPPMEVFHTASPPGLLNHDHSLVGQGSENQVDARGIPVLRVPAPDDLSVIGAFDADLHEKHQGQDAIPPTQATVQPTPALPPLAAVGQLPQLAQLARLTPQQLAMMQLLAALSPGLSPGLPTGPLVAPQQHRTIVTSSPVFITTTVTTTSLRGVVVTFRATPSTAYITTSGVVSTVLTSYLTSTLRMATTPFG